MPAGVVVVVCFLVVVARVVVANGVVAVRASPSAPAVIVETVSVTITPASLVARERTSVLPLAQGKVVVSS